MSAAGVSKIAVVSDGSAYTDINTPLTLALRSAAALIHELTGEPTEFILCDPDDAIKTSLAALPADIGAVYLVHTDPTRAIQAQRAASVPVVTDLDMVATSLMAEVLSALSQAGRAPAASRIVVTGGNQLPNMGPLLMAAGIGDITFWNPQDAPAFPLPQIATRADVVVDLLEQLTPGLLTTQAAPTVITPHHGRAALLVLPGLLHTITQVPDVQLVDFYSAIARALAEDPASLERLLPAPRQEHPPGPPAPAPGSTSS